MTDVAILVPGGALLGEGPCWDDTAGHLLWVDINAGIVHRTDLAGIDDPIVLGGQVGSVVPRVGGGYIVGLKDRVSLLNAGGVEEQRLPIEADIPDARMNDGKCDIEGRFFTGTLTHGKSISALYRVDPDLAVTTVFTDVSISNGLGWNLDHTQMYYIDTPTGRVDVCDFDRATGEVEHRRPLVEVPENCGSPDGMTVDAEGCLWVAFWGGSCVRRYDPAGAVMAQVDLPASQITSAAFGGPDHDQLFVTSATEGFSDAQRAEEPHAGSVFQLDVGVKGLPANRFAG